MPKFLRKLVNLLDGKPAGTRGQSLVEMTVTIPILLGMILSMAEVAFLANNYLSLMDAVREAARNAVTLDPKGWPDNGSRNFQRLDCDNDNGTYNLFGTFNAGGYGNRLADNPRATNLEPYGYAPDSFNKDYDLGFFDGTACYVLGVLSPIRFDDSATGKDDVVVSAISYAQMDFNNTALIGARGSLSNTAPISDPSKGSSGTGKLYSRYYNLVTGRWPLENRMCYSTSAASSDWRDPFDYLRPEYQTQYKSSVTGSMKGTTVGPASDDNELGYYSGSGLVPTAPRLLLGSGSSQNVRGYTFAGKQNADGCYGSRFNLSKVEQLLNTTAFSQQGLRSKTKNGGLVIVEVQWQHHPFFLGAIFNRNGTSENDPLLNVYAIFPVPSVEPTATP